MLGMSGNGVRTGGDYPTERVFDYVGPIEELSGFVGGSFERECLVLSNNLSLLSRAVRVFLPLAFGLHAVTCERAGSSQ